MRSGDNIRRRAEDISEDDHLLGTGERLDARHVALLAAQGLTDVRVRRRARVGILSTGNELRQPGTTLNEGTIYDSNRPMLLSIAREAGLHVVDGGCFADEPHAIASALSSLAECCDLLVTTGGASVGEEDHSARAMELSGSEFETLRIALKPGKPAVVGRIGSCGYIGLPGNAVSALVCWLLIGCAMVSRLEGRAVERRPGCPMRAASAFKRRPGRTEFAPARIVNMDTGGAIEFLGRGGSARLRPLVLADGLAEIAALHAPVEAGDTVLFHPLRNGFIV